jgi:hypothetical protein
LSSPAATAAAIVLLLLHRCRATATFPAAANLPPHCLGCFRQAAIATAELPLLPPLLPLPRCHRTAVAAAVLPPPLMPRCHHCHQPIVTKLLPPAPLPLFLFVVVAVIVTISVAITAADFC